MQSRTSKNKELRLSKPTYKVDKDSLREVMLLVWEKVKKGVESEPVIVTLSRESRTDLQNRKLHAMIGDIANQIELENSYSLDVWKALLVDQFEEELALEGKKLNKPGRCVPSLDGRRVVQVRASTKDMDKLEEMNAFIEYLYAFGAENKIVWSDPETRSMGDSYGQ